MFLDTDFNRKLHLMTLAFVVLVILFTLGSLVPGAPLASSSPQPTPTLREFQSSHNIYRYYDGEADVVCWVFDAGDRGSGISCLPISETKLDK